MAVNVECMGFSCAVQRQASVLIWVPLLLLSPLLSLPAGVAGHIGGVALVILMGAVAVTAVRASRRSAGTAAQVLIQGDQSLCPLGRRHSVDAIRRGGDHACSRQTSQLTSTSVPIGVYG